MLLMERFTSLHIFSDQCWRLLLNGAVKKNDPLRLPVLGTAMDGSAHLRTVVLRKVDVAQRQLTFYTDVRSAKVAHLKEHPVLTGLFYHPKKQVQIRTEGRTYLHHQNEMAQTIWESLPIHLRKPYAATLPPGSASEAATDGVPDFWQQDMALSDTEYAYAHFAVLVCEVERLEALLLHPEGHQRAAFTWEKEQWEGTWLIP